MSLNEWLIRCARICDEQGYMYEILASHFYFRKAFDLGVTPDVAVAQAKAAWEKWYLNGDKRNVASS